MSAIAGLKTVAGAVKPSLTLKRRLNAPPALVYAAWTKPEMIAQWWGCAETQEILLAETDPRQGGAFRVMMRTADGQTHDIGGVYREAAPFEKLVFTWVRAAAPEHESLVTVTIKPDGAGSLLTVMHEMFADEETRDQHNYGWGGSLDRLEKLFAPAG